MRSGFLLTSAAKADLQKIAIYTAQKWGIQQAQKYREILEKTFFEIGQNTVYSKPLIHIDLKVRICRCRQHYIFFIPAQNDVPAVILAVFHERMDLLTRLRERL